MPIEGFEPYRPEDVERYVARRWWLGLTWGDMFDKATDLYPQKMGLVDDTEEKDSSTTLGNCHRGRDGSPIAVG